MKKTPGGRDIGFHYTKAKGIVIGGPSIKSGDIWWNINYDMLSDGWSTQDGLKKFGLPKRD